MANVHDDDEETLLFADESEWMDVSVICPECGEPIQAANQGTPINSGEILHIDCAEAASDD